MKTSAMQLLYLTKRAIVLFFRDKTTVFFALLAQLIILFLYIAFLRDTYIDTILVNIPETFQNTVKGDVSNLINAWLLSGLIGSATITISLSSLSLMIADRETKRDFDFMASPIKRSVVMLSYFLGAIINSYLVSAFILTIGLIILVAIGNLYLSILDVVILYLFLILAVTSSTLILMAITMFFKKTTNLNAFSGLVSAGIGFFIGAYMPIGSFSVPVQYVANILPGSHVTAIFRNILMSGPLEVLSATMVGGELEFTTAIKNTFAFDLNFFGVKLGVWQMSVYIGVATIVFLGIDLYLARFSSKRR